MKEKNLKRIIFYFLIINLSLINFFTFAQENLYEPTPSPTVTSVPVLSFEKKEFLAKENIWFKYEGEPRFLNFELKNDKGEILPYQAVLKNKEGVKIVEVETTKQIKSGNYHIKVSTPEQTLLEDDVFWGQPSSNSAKLANSLDENDEFFSIEREAPSEISYNHEYEAKIKVTAKEDLKGKVIEYVPLSIQLVDPADYTVFLDRNSLSLRRPFLGKFELSQPFKTGEHDGVDFALSEGTEVLAVDEGVVIPLPEGMNYGETILIQHKWGRSLYGHLSKKLVETGKQVKKGDAVGLSGNTGHSTGPHLHFGVQLNDEKGELKSEFVDGLPLLSYKNNFGVSYQKLVWDLDLKKGEERTLNYKFKPLEQDYSFYFLKPLEVVKDDTKFFVEKELWEMRFVEESKDLEEVIQKELEDVSLTPPATPEAILTPEINLTPEAEITKIPLPKPTHIDNLSPLHLE